MKRINSKLLDSYNAMSLAVKQVYISTYGLLRQVIDCVGCLAAVHPTVGIIIGEQRWWRQPQFTIDLVTSFMVYN